MLDRVGLSVENGWVDEKRRVYIYFTQEEAMAALRCGKDKITKLFRELDQSGIGLIERRKQGLGHPTRIYVKDFTPPAEPEPTIPGESAQSTEYQRSEDGFSAPMTAEIPSSAPLETSGLDSGFSAAIKTDKTKTDFINTELSIHPPTPFPRRPRASPGAQSQLEKYRTVIRKNISYDILVRDYGMDPDLIDGYVELMAEVCDSTEETVWISKKDVAIDKVRKRFLELDMTHITYVMDCLSQTTSQITNIRAYTLSVLYNAPITMDQYYDAQVRHDIAQRRREAES